MNWIFLHACIWEKNRVHWHKTVMRGKSGSCSKCLRLSIHKLPWDVVIIKAELSYSNLHKIISKPFSASIENISIFKLSHEALNLVSLRNSKTKPRGIFFVMYELQSTDLIFKDPTVCKINNLPKKLSKYK